MIRLSASEDEAAAIAAAVARFEAETAAAPAEDGAVLSPWQRAALLEGVSGIGVVVEAEGGSRWLS
jgi:hypothetical protein